MNEEIGYSYKTTYPKVGLTGKSQDFYAERFPVAGPGVLGPAVFLGSGARTEFPAKSGTYLQ